MNENTAHTTTLPPILPTPAGPGAGARTGRLEELYAVLRRLPARDTDGAVLGGVCATLAHRLGVAPAVVRAAAVLSALVLGVGVGLYLIAWTVLPDGTGRTHLEQALSQGRGRSLAVLALGTMAALGVVMGGLSFITAILPELIGLAALGALGWFAWTRLADRSRTTS